MISDSTLRGNAADAGGAGGTGGAAAAGGGGTGGGASGVAVYDAATQTAPYPGAGLTLQNTLLALNPGGKCSAPALADAGHNLSFGDSSCPASFIGGDPNLGPLQDNGGPAWTIALGAGSAANRSDPGDRRRLPPRPTLAGCRVRAGAAARSAPTRSRRRW